MSAVPAFVPVSVPMPMPAATLLIWRHPRPVGAAGRCIGRTDLPVPARRAKRLAHRIRRLARREGLAREVWSSPLRRCADVARWLRRWGWRHHVDPLLLELDFGRWDGLAWSRIDPAEVAAWEADFGAHAPGGGESLLQIRQRVSAHLAGLAAAGGPRLLVGHAGWINTLRLLERADLTPQDWPAAPAHGTLQRWPPESPGSRCG